MNKANKIDARYSVAQAIQRNWQGYLRSLNKQQFFGIVRKGHTLIVYFHRVKFKNGATKCLGGIAFQLKSWRREYVFSDLGYKELW